LEPSKTSLKGTNPEPLPEPAKLTRAEKQARYEAEKRARREFFKGQ
jgi:hypothetical protein